MGAVGPYADVINGIYNPVAVDSREGYQWQKGGPNADPDVWVCRFALAWSMGDLERSGLPVRHPLCYRDTAEAGGVEASIFQGLLESVRNRDFDILDHQCERLRYWDEHKRL